jgi:hypothetical protein
MTQFVCFGLRESGWLDVNSVPIRACHKNLFVPVTKISIRYSEVIKNLFEAILCGKACIPKEPSLPVPLAQTSIVKHFHAIGNDKRDDSTSQAFLEHDQPSDASVAVLEWVDDFKTDMEVDDIIQGLILDCVV